MANQHWQFLPSDRWVRTTIGGETIADSKQAMLLVESRGELDTYYNAVWTYPDPIPEAPKLKNLLAFWPEKDKRIKILVDGQEPLRKQPVSHSK